MLTQLIDHFNIVTSDNVLCALTLQFKTKIAPKHLSNNVENRVFAIKIHFTCVSMCHSNYL